MRMKNHKLLLPVAVAAAAAAALLSVFMTLSYLTDTEVADNKITIGSVALEIHEGDYEDSQKIAAGGSLPKAPSIENTGKNDEYVFIEVSVPKKEVTLLYEEDDENNHKTGQKIQDEASVAEIFKMIAEGTNTDNITGNDPPEYVFSYNKGDAGNNKEGWVFLSGSTDRTGSAANKYYFGYNKKLVAGSSTDNRTITLFDKVTLKSFIEQELGIGNVNVQIGIRAFGIQADELGVDGLDSELLSDTTVGKLYEIVERKQGAA